MMTNTYTPVVGGVEESIRAFSRQFKKMGHQVLIVAPEFEGLPAGQAGRPRHETMVLRIPAIQKFNHSDFSINLPIPGLLSRLTREFKPDVVHSHHPFLIGDMALRLCGQYGIPLVFTYHTMFEDYLHYLPFQNERIKRFVIELAIGYANLTDRVIVPSQSIYDILQKRGVDVPMDVVPTGVDLTKFAHGDRSRIRRQFNIPPDAFVVGHVGRLTPEKNLEFLTETVAGLMKQRDHVHFLVVGQGPLEDVIKHIFEKYNLSHRLHLTGVLRDQDVVDGYHAMDVFAFSSYTETQGLVLVEAMAAGLPVVALDAPGAREALRDGKNGRLVSKQSQEDFAQALSWCLDRSPEEFERLKNGARQTAEHYSIETLAQRTVGIYESLQPKSYMLSEEKHSVWSGIMHRIRTEWEMARNIIEASEAALRSTETASAADLHQHSWVIKVRRWLNPHEWSARLLNLSKSETTEAHPGLILIQIDGFSRSQLMRALAQGEMPFTQRLLQSQGYKMHPLYTGLPSSTPAVQGELFYGVKQIVPAFVFYDRNNNKVSRMYDREAARKVEEQLQRKQAEQEGKGAQGLLAGGSSYSNVYGGGACETHFCAVKIGLDMIWAGINPFKIALLCATHFYGFTRMVVLMAAEIFLAAADCIDGVLSGESVNKELKFIPTRAVICVLLRELLMLGAKTDIARGLPIVHMNFLGFDEQAHRRGPSTKFAHRALWGIDHAVAKIYRQAMHSTRRNYDVWIYSDHGQEDGLSYAMVHGKTLRQVVGKIYEEFMAGRKGAGHHSRDLKEDAAGHDDQHGVQAQRVRYLGGWFTRRLLSMIGLSDIDNENQKDTSSDRIVVTAIGPTANIYLPEKFNRKERDQFARQLVRQGQLPAVLASDGPGRVLVWREDGEFRLPEHAGQVIGENHPYLAGLTEDLINICHHPLGGEYTILGWYPGRKPVTFPIENGAHAGPGTEETNAFALLPSDIISTPDAGGYLCTRDLREAALRLLGRLKKKEAALAARPVSSRRSENFKKTRTLRVMTYNVHSCIGTDGKISPQRIARVIGRHEPDIVAIQELDLKRARTGGMDQPHMIAKELEMIYHFHPSIELAEERYGSALLSRYPLTLIKAGRLPTPARNADLEPRGAMWCSVDTGDGKIQVINTHLGLRPDERFKQMTALCGPQWLSHPDCQGPIILCGDFNALPNSRVCCFIRRRLRDVQTEMEGHAPRATWFSHWPVGRIDHVFVSPGIEIVRVAVSITDLDKKSSDHLPLITDIRIPLGQ